MEVIRQEDSTTADRSADNCKVSDFGPLRQRVLEGESELPGGIQMRTREWRSATVIDDGAAAIQARR